MPELITSPIGMTIDPWYGNLYTGGTAFTVGDIVVARAATAGSAIDTIYVATDTAESNAQIFAVVTETATTSDTQTRVCFRGVLDAHVYESIAVAINNPMLICSVYDTTGSVPDDALTSAGDIDPDAATAVVDGATGTVTVGGAKIIGVYLGAAAAAGSQVAKVMFNGVEGFGYSLGTSVITVTT